LIAAVRFATARQENEVRSEKARALYEKRRREGRAYIGNRPPYGLRLVDGKLQPELKFKKTIATAFKMRLAGDGYHLIGKRLEAIAPQREFKNGRTYRTFWTETRVRRLLQTEAYNGTIVDEVTWHRAQSVNQHLGRDRAQPNKYPWPLGGALHCVCGKILKGINAGPQRHRIRYYRCPNVAEHGMNLLFRADAAEEAFLRLIDTLQASEDLEQSWSSQRVESTLEARRHELSQAKTTLAAIERKRDRAWEAHAAGNITGDQLQERLAQLDHDRVNTASIIRELDGQIGAATASLTERATAGEVLRNARRLYKSADPDRQRQIARLVARALGGLTLKKPMELMIGTAMETG
jgi:hypothetical protein